MYVLRNYCVGLKIFAQLQWLLLFCVKRCLHCKGEGGCPGDPEHSARRGCVRREEGVRWGELSVCLSVSLSVSPSVCRMCIGYIWHQVFCVGTSCVWELDESVNNEAVNGPIDFVSNQVLTPLMGMVCNAHASTDTHRCTCMHAHTHTHTKRVGASDKRLWCSIKSTSVIIHWCVMMMSSVWAGSVGCTHVQSTPCLQLSWSDASIFDDNWADLFLSLSPPSPGRYRHEGGVQSVESL